MNVLMFSLLQLQLWWKLPAFVGKRNTELKGSEGLMLTQTNCWQRSKKQKYWIQHTNFQMLLEKYLKTKCITV